MAELTEATKKYMGIKKLSPKAEAFRQYVGTLERTIDQTLGFALSDMDKKLGDGILSDYPELEDYCRETLSKVAHEYLQIGDLLGDMNKKLN